MSQSTSARSRSSRVLLDDLRKSHAGRRWSGSPARSQPTAPAAAYDFSAHPAYFEVRLAKATSETLGIASPYFRVAEAVEGTKVRIGGRWLTSFASYDYLSLNRTDALKASAAEAIADWGVSATASRLVGGETLLHGALEARIADFVGTEAALAMVSGHATNVGIVSTLVGPGDLVLVDALAHNSIYEGIRRSGAAHATFPHNDHAWCANHLADVRGDYRNVLVAIEGLYSMDGDVPDLERFVALKERHGAWLMVDEAHSAGVLGATGRGICEAQGVDPTRIEVIMGTLSKSFCSCGGFVAGSTALVDLMRYRAPGFVYSVGLSAPNTAAAIQAIDMIRAEPARVAHLSEVGRSFLARARDLGLDTGGSEGHAVCPIIVGDSVKAVWIANRLFEAGFNVLPIIAPAVPNQSARLRFFVNHDHSPEDIDAVLTETAALLGQAKGMTMAAMAAG